MAKVTKSELSRIRSELKSKTHEELHIVVPKNVAATFRQIAKAAKMTTVALFEEMVEAHAAGMSLKSKSQ